MGLYLTNESFQDSLGMTHYLFFVGSPDSGKSNRLLVFNFLAYRNFMSTDVTPSNIYRFLGSQQEGQGTICEDEADDLDESPEKMKIYKSGYTAGFKVARNEDSINGGMSQSAYCTYGFKVFSAERLPDSVKAKGLIQRLIELNCYACITGKSPSSPTMTIAKRSGSIRVIRTFALRCSIF